MNRAGARPLTSRNSRRVGHLRDGRQRKSQSHHRRFTHCTAGTAPLYIQAERLSPLPSPSGGERALKSRRGGIREEPIFSLYLFASRGISAGCLACYLLPGILTCFRLSVGFYKSGWHKKIRNGLLLFRTVYIFPSRACIVSDPVFSLSVKSRFLSKKSP